MSHAGLLILSRYNYLINCGGANWAQRKSWKSTVWICVLIYKNPNAIPASAMGLWVALNRSRNFRKHFSWEACVTFTKSAEKSANMWCYLLPECLGRALNLEHGFLLEFGVCLINSLSLFPTFQLIITLGHHFHILKFQLWLIST